MPLPRKELAYLEFLKPLGRGLKTTWEGLVFLLCLYRDGTPYYPSFYSLILTLFVTFFLELLFIWPCGHSTLPCSPHPLSTLGCGMRWYLWTQSYNQVNLTRAWESKWVKQSTTQMGVCVHVCWSIALILVIPLFNDSSFQVWLLFEYYPFVDDFHMVVRSPSYFMWKNRLVIMNI